MKYRHEKWAALLIEELCRKEEGIMKAEKAVKKISRDYRKFARNMAIMKNSMDRASDIYNARLEGKAEGLAEGKAEGLTEGKTVGFKLAQNEAYLEKLEIARRLKALDIPVEKIQAATGFSLEKIESM